MASSTPNTRTAPVVADPEYENLPWNIQKKFFSSLERLRLADASFPSSPSQPFYCQSVARQLSRSYTSGGLLRCCSSDASDCPTRRRPFGKPRSASDDDDHRHGPPVSEAEAKWFLSLPDKVRRRHFSREEQVLLAGGGDTGVSSASQCHTRPSITRARSEGRVVHRSDRPRRIEGGDRTVISKIALDGGKAKGVTLTTCAIEDDREETKEEKTHKDKCGDHNMTTPDAAKVERGRGIPFRRTMSLSTKPFVRSASMSAPSKPISPAFPAPRSRANSFIARHQRDLSVTAVDPAAIHYQDPEARMKLRVYLASPQKFDEAIEFGFPSSGPDTAAVATPPISDKPPQLPDPRKVNLDVQTFLNADTFSFLDTDEYPTVNDDDDDDDDSSSESDGESPATPHLPDDDGFHLAATPDLPRSHMSSLDSNGLPPLTATPPLQKRPPVHPRQLTLPSSAREMTLRMTLTRPDLRAAGDDERLHPHPIHGWRPPRQRLQKAAPPPPREEDPLALEELALSDDTTGEHGAFAVPARKGPLVRRLLRRVTWGPARR